ncbi:hypothetical protein GTU71_10245 [Rathayibacter sp. VKM Ac-2762]|uniref:IS110 family transposase n=1 Tax=Rathayibacter sp. VKM Ac-2762 TaxID=2609254 RepID=UPI00132EA11F|nr:transposase [Rathayibacter sp. VKM Ac-2762]QHF21172.1 hypothetical protein GTU71_10245 [Rathayibacter sp. VKM Ac-2762]
MPQLWAGIDAGKTEHHCVVIDGNGTKLLSQRGRTAEDAARLVGWSRASLYRHQADATRRAAAEEQAASQ